MLNWIAIWVGSYLFGEGGPLQGSRASIPVSNTIVDGAKLPVFWGLKLLQGLSIGIFIAIAMLVLYWVLVNRTTLGFAVRAVGFNPEAARYSGISVGAQLLPRDGDRRRVRRPRGRDRRHRLGVPGRAGRLQASQIGFIGLAAALLGRNTAVGVGFASLLFGALITGTSSRQLDPTIFRPDLAENLTIIIQGLVVLFVGLNLGALWTWLRRDGGAHEPLDAEPRRRSGLAGIALGALAFWLALPPLAARTAALPILIGLLAIVAGIWAASRGASVATVEAAIAAGVLGIVLGVLATRSSSAHLDSVVVWGALGAATLRYATPLTFAAIGGLYCERSGVINVALEGMLLTGAFFGIWGAIWAHTWAGGLAWVVGLAAAALAGMALAAIHAVWAISFKIDQIISGTAINFLALGITGYLFVDKYGDTGTPGNVPDYGIPDIHLHFLQNWTLIGPIFGQLNLMIWLSFAAARRRRTSSSSGRRRDCGSARSASTRAPRTPSASRSPGSRYIAVIASGAIAAMGGAYLSLGFVHSFNQGMTNGIGFIGLAALIFGKWRPFPAWGAALLFGFSSALADRLPAAYGNQWGTLFQALPYLLTLIAVGGLVGRSIGPAAAGRPYAKQ